MSKATDPVLKFVGKRDAGGRPVEFYEGVPARDLTERDLARVGKRYPELVKALTKPRPTANGTAPALYEAVKAPPPPVAPQAPVAPKALAKD